MVAKADQARVRDLIAETITLLCKNGLHFKSEFSIQALIGITLDQNEVFLVKIDETIAVSENGQLAVDSLLISTDAESDQDTRHALSTSKHRGNPKEYDYAKKRLKPGLKCAYSTVSHTDAGSPWQRRNSQHGTIHDEKEMILTDDVEKTVNASATCAINETLPSQRRKEYQNEISAVQTSTSASMGRTERHDVDSTDTDVAKTLDSDNRIMGNCTSNGNSSNQGHSHGNNLYPEIKEEPNDDEGAYSFHAYQDQILSSYNVANLLHSQILQSHLTTDQSVIDNSSLQTHHHQLIQHELIDSNAASHYQAKGGLVRRPGLGGGQSFRRRMLGGPVYRMPRNHVCNMCGKAFEKKRDLRGHLAAKHQMQKEHKCDICGKEFSYKRSLTDHMFVHAYKNASMNNG